jgi:hypothetical protein
LEREVDRLKVIANDTCKTQHGWLHCQDDKGYLLHYLLIAEPNAWKCGQTALLSTMGI